ncbi:uncharacterized protein LOC130717285 [Lotus japonicus]|uniref:uncharacterized protein LOC130717285 n=1 Tax=Lotus japonicus TaxID=34305 RepID=UPI0025890440|nr:uncharacterized protein LOC130717285 [Lotus japonicus]
MLESGMLVCVAMTNVSRKILNKGSNFFDSTGLGMDFEGETNPQSFVYSFYCTLLPIIFISMHKVGVCFIQKLMKEDFYAMRRKILEALCKKHGIPANLKNK